MFPNNKYYGIPLTVIAQDKVNHFIYGATIYSLSSFLISALKELQFGQCWNFTNVT
jgi:hypothetical protein